jgi:chromosomal replication initiation ATPase DnaA
MEIIRLMRAAQVATGGSVKTDDRKRENCMARHVFAHLALEQEKRHGALAQICRTIGRDHSTVRRNVLMFRGLLATGDTLATEAVNKAINYLENN